VSAANAPRAVAIRSMAPALRPHWRAVRVGVLGAASLVLATSAHIIGGGTLPSLGVLALTALVLGLVAVPLTGRRCRTGVVVAVLGVQQSLLHLVFTAVAEQRGCEPSDLVATAHQLGAACAMDMPMGMPMTAAGASWPMILAHAAATAATAWLLARGEAWLWRTAEQVVRVAGTTLTRRVANDRDQVVLPRQMEVWTAPAYAVAAPRGPPASG
jgi:hypothetical protein